MDRPSDFSRRATWIVFALGVIGAAPLLMAPVILGSLATGLNLDPARTGSLLTAMLIGFTCSNVAIVRLLSRVDLRRLLAAALALFAAAALATLLQETPAKVAAALFTMGAGAGAVLATAFSLHAGRRDHDRAFAVQFTITTAALIVLFPLVAFLRERWGWSAIFLIFAGTAAAAVPMVLTLPPFHRRTPPPSDMQAHGYALRAALPVLSAILLLSFANFNVWSLVERIGATQGFPTDWIGKVLGAAAFAGFAAGLFATWLGVRAGRVWPIVGALAVLAGAGWVLLAGERTTFIAGVLAFYAAMIFINPYLFGTLGAVDPQGRAVVLGAAMQNGGLTIAPAIAGVLASHNFAPVLRVTDAAYGLIALLMIWAVRNLNRPSTLRGASATPGD